MKAINKTSAKILRKMVGMMVDGYAKVQNSPSFMAVVIEHIG